MNKEIRQYGMSPSDFQTSDGLFCRGIVNKPGKWSHPLTTRDGKKFIERIMPNAFTKALQRNNVVDLLGEHDKEKLLASTQNDSLKLTETSDGLLMEAQLSETDFGKRYHTWIKDGLVPDMSFGFQVLKDHWKKLNDGTYERSITDLALFEISAVRQGAYPDGEISARSEDSIIDIEIPEIEERNFEIMNLKEAKQKKQDLIKQVKPILDIQEQRSLEPDEQLKKQILSDEIRELSEHIEELEAKNKSVENRGNDKMTNQTEIRAVEQFIRNQEGEELRALQAGTGVGALTVPTSLHDEVVGKLYEVAPLFAMSKNYTPVNGYLEILREQSLGGSSAQAFVAEMVEVPKADITMDKVKLEQRRVGTAIELSQQLINDSGIDVVEHATNVLTRRVGYLMNRAVLNGDKNAGQFEGLLGSVSIENVTAGSATGIAIDELLDVYNAMNPELIPNAVWVVGRKAFNMIAKLKDADGHFYLVRDVAETGVTYRLFGQPVFINDAMPDPAASARTVLFGNFERGYATMTKKGLTFKKLDQTSDQALKGSVMLMLDGYMDGKIYNENAFKFLIQKSS